MIDMNETELPLDLAERIKKDFIYQVATLMKDKPVYLSSLILDLDRLMEYPEDERAEPLKQIIGSLKYSSENQENKKIII